MNDPQPASLFHRNRTPEPMIRGLEKTEAHSALRLPLVCRILTVEFHTALTSLEGVATLRLEASPLMASHLRMQFAFRNVRELTLGQISAEGLACSCFGIEDARHLGAAGVNWEVGDSKSDSIHFYAEDAEIVSITMGG